MGPKNISDDTKKHILDLRRNGASIGQIASRIGLSKSTVHMWCKRGEGLKAGEAPPTFHAPGRARVTSPATDRVMKRTVKEHPLISARLLQQEMPESLGHVAIRTIQHRLQKDLDLPARRPAYKPMLTRAMKAKRLAFAKRYKDWTFQDWKKVMFTDESTFRVLSKHRCFVRRPRGSDRSDSKYSLKTVKKPASVMVWGGFGSRGAGPLHFLDQNVTMNSRRYISVLSKYLPRWMRRLQTEVLLQDNAPCHASRMTRRYLERKAIRTIDWPGNSPDLNPIENLWNEAKWQLHRYDTTSIPKLVEALKELWQKGVDRSYCKTLVRSMPRRLKSVIAKKGDMTKY